MWELDYKESWALKNWCFWTVVFEKTLESPLDCKEVQPVHPKGNHSWIFIGRIDGWSWSSNTLATWCEELTPWKRPWCWERLKAGGKGDDRGWDGWMTSPTLWTWVWASSGSWWWPGKPARPWGHKESDATEWQLNWSEVAKLRLRCFSLSCLYFWLQWVFVAVCRLSLVAVSSGHSVFRVLGLPVAVASFVVEYKL